MTLVLKSFSEEEFITQCNRILSSDFQGDNLIANHIEITELAQHFDDSAYCRYLKHKTKFHSQIDDSIEFYKYLLDSMKRACTFPQFSNQEITKHLDLLYQQLISPETPKVITVIELYHLAKNLGANNIYSEILLSLCEVINRSEDVSPSGISGDDIAVVVINSLKRHFQSPSVITQADFMNHLKHLSQQLENTSNKLEFMEYLFEVCELSRTLTSTSDNPFAQNTFYDFFRSELLGYPHQTSSFAKVKPCLQALKNYRQYFFDENQHTS